LVDPTADSKDASRNAARGFPAEALPEGPAVGLVLTAGAHNVLAESANDQEKNRARMQDAVYNSKVANAVNKRFHTVRNGVKVPMAKAETSN